MWGLNTLHGNFGMKLMKTHTLAEYSNLDAEFKEDSLDLVYSQSESFGGSENLIQVTMGLGNLCRRMGV